MRYSIGDVSRVLGMTTSALHFYEKEGIIDTPKVESGRRYYKEADINRLISAKKYRAMGVPVRDIAHQFSAQGLTGEQVMERMREKREAARCMIEQYARLVEDIDRLIEVGGQALDAEGVVDICKTKEMLAFLSNSGGRIPRDKDEQAVVQKWLDAVPAVSVGICCDVLKKRTMPGLVIGRERAEAAGLSAHAPGVHRIEGGMALHAIVACGEEQHEYPDVIFAPVLAFAREHRFTPKGMMWGAQIFADCSCERRKYYYDTYMYFE